MKKCCIMLLLWLCAVFSLSAQFKNNIFIFFPSITGTGHSLNDNRLLVNMLTAELVGRKYILLNTPQGADFLLYGTLVLFDENKNYVDNIRPTITYTYNAGLQDYTYKQLYIFQLVLRKVDSGEIVLHNILYVTIDDIYIFFPVILNNLFTHIGGLQPADRWTDNWLYVGASAFWSPRTYNGSQEEGLQSVSFVNFGGGISAEAHLLKYLSFEAGAEITLDRVAYSPIAYSPTETYPNLMLEVPLAFKFFWKVTHYYMLAPYAGIHVNVPFDKTTDPPLAAWMLGVTSGVRIGQGIIFIDPRFSMDIGRSKLDSNQFDSVDYQRHMVHIGIGYKHGFFAKK